jgi:predicted ATP-dependent serine protease
MARSLTIKNLYDKKFKTFEFDGVWLDTMGTPEVNGAWLVYGAEKNGKTWFSLTMAEYLSKFAKTLYISAEEGTGMTFVDACKRAKINLKSKSLRFLEYTPIDELDERMSKKRSEKIIIIDNITIYADELKNGVVRKLLRKHKDKLIIFIAHEERNEPYTATAKLVRKLAKIIIRVQGLACFVSGRCKGGVLMIDENKAMLYHGTQIAKK